MQKKKKWTMHKTLNDKVEWNSKKTATHLKIKRQQLTGCSWLWHQYQQVTLASENPNNMWCEAIQKEITRTVAELHVGSISRQQKVKYLVYTSPWVKRLMCGETTFCLTGKVADDPGNNVDCDIRHTVYLMGLW